MGQAGVRQGIASLVEQRFPEIGQVVKTATPAIVAVNQLAGPVLFRIGLFPAEKTAGILNRRLSSHQPVENEHQGENQSAIQQAPGQVVAHHQLPPQIDPQCPQNHDLQDSPRH